jgi:hypothetical protein
MADRDGRVANSGEFSDSDDDDDSARSARYRRPHRRNIHCSRDDHQQPLRAAGSAVEPGIGVAAAAAAVSAWGSGGGGGGGKGARSWAAGGHGGARGRPLRGNPASLVGSLGSALATGSGGAAAGSPASAGGGEESSLKRIWDVCGSSV